MPASDLAALLAAAHTLTLATVDDAGRPHAADLWYVRDAEGRFYFVSNPESAHCRHIARRPDVALTVHGECDAPEQIHGVQIHGRAEMVTDPTETALVIRLFAERFPAVAANPLLREHLLAERFYRITPTWRRWIDNRRGFGWKSEEGQLGATV